MFTDPRRQVELGKFLWPTFIYSYLELVEGGYPEDASQFFNSFRTNFENVHADELKTLATVTLPQHVRENSVTKLYKSAKYRIPLNTQAAHLFYGFLDREPLAGGTVLADLFAKHCDIEQHDRGPMEPYSFEAIYRRAQKLDLEDADVVEGIPGAFTGISNRDVMDTSTPLRLGPLPMEPELRDDVRAELEEEDSRNPPADGRPSLVEEFERKIKREESADVPNRADLPLPPSRARDVVMEVQKIRENRDRFRIEGRTGGVGVALSACMFTFHNTLGRCVVCCAFVLYYRRSRALLTLRCF